MTEGEQQQATNADAESVADDSFDAALQSVKKTLERIKGCSEQERKHLQEELAQLLELEHKLTSGRVEIVVFGEISTGKSALINALIGDAVTAVDVRGGWTKEVWDIPWEGSGHCIAGLDESQLVLIDTPGLNEVGGQDRGDMAGRAAEKADLILFVTDSDLNETEFSELTSLAGRHKPIIVVLNKSDLYSPDQLVQLSEIIQQRLANFIPAANLVAATADPREIEYVTEAADGSSSRNWQKPAADVEQVKARVLEILSTAGLELLALNAAMYTADKSDRIAVLRVQMRDSAAEKVIWSCAVVKAMAVSLNPIGYVDVAGGVAVDAAMVAALGRIYGLELAWQPAKELVTAIAKAAGWATLAQAITHFVSSSLKLLSGGTTTVLTAVPQGVAAGYGSYIVGQAAKYYFELGASWGNESPKVVVQRILKNTDKASVVARIKGELKDKLKTNPHAKATRAGSPKDQ